jgi:sugar/nucleoside kinase (ribokinase family)
MPASSRIVCVGLCTLDVIQYYEERPAWGGKGVATATLVDVGGPAANAAVTVSLLAGRATLVTAVGHGAEARVALDRLHGHSVEVQDCASGDSVLPVSSIWVDGVRGERTVLSTNRVASVAVPSPTALEGCAAVLIDGHHPELASAVAHAAHERGIPLVLDGGSWRPVFEELLGLARVAIVSSAFRLPGDGARDLDLARAVQRRWGTPSVAVTRGPRDVAWVDGDRSGSTPVPPCEAVDTLGAGDVLHGAYVWLRYGQGRTHADALMGACAAASESCRHRGARAGVREYAGEAGAP